MPENYVYFAVMESRDLVSVSRRVFFFVFLILSLEHLALKGFRDFAWVIFYEVLQETTP